MPRGSSTAAAAIKAVAPRPYTRGRECPRPGPAPGPSHLQSDWHKALPVLVHLARSLVSPHQSADVMANAQQMRGMLEANRRRPGPRPYPTRGQTAAMKKPVRP